VNEKTVDYFEGKKILKSLPTSVTFALICEKNKTDLF